jgi:CheY-like chemotaxis protein
MPLRKILLADDDAEDQTIMRDAVASLGSPDVLWFVSNGQQALQLLEENIAIGVPCLIVLDLNMPKMSGTQTLTTLKSDARFRQIPVIIYSTSINPLEKEKCLSLGAHSYITKPLSFKESVDTAKTFLQFCS